jgi:hypothetical protein
VIERKLALVGFCALFVGCHDELPSSRASASASAPALASAEIPTPGDAAPTKLPPLGDASWLEHLKLDGFGDAFVSVPLGATEPRPVMIGVHGRNDRPEWACGEWRGVTNAYPFIVCPHGTPAGAPSGVGLAFADAATTSREIDAAVAALSARFGRYVAPGPFVYAGFSLGAIHGARIVTQDPARYPLVVVGEGGYDLWTAEAIARFARGGGRRVLFVCSTLACEEATRAALRRFQSTQADGGAVASQAVETRLVSAGAIGHLVDGRVVDAIRPAFPWLVRDDPRYAAMGTPQ